MDKIPETAIRCARFIGLSVPMHTAMRVGMDITRHIRTINKEAYLCFYGLYASLNAEYLLSHGAEAVISGEYEQSLLDLICTLETDAPIMVSGVRPEKTAKIMKIVSKTCRMVSRRSQST